MSARWCSGVVCRPLVGGRDVAALGGGDVGGIVEYVVDGDQARALPLYGRSSGLLAYFSGVCDLSR